jgi:hypothetical protein
MSSKPLGNILPFSDASSNMEFSELRVDLTTAVLLKVSENRFAPFKASNVFSIT